MTFPGPTNNTFSPYVVVWARGELWSWRGRGFARLFFSVGERRKTAARRVVDLAKTVISLETLLLFDIFFCFNLSFAYVYLIVHQSFS